MYTKEDLEYGEVIDSENDYESAESAYLRHSCQEWVIGGRKEIENLISDLQEILNEHFKEK